MIWDLVVMTIQETYSDEALTLFAQHPKWDLGDLERECSARGIEKYRCIHKEKSALPP